MKPQPIVSIMPTFEFPIVRFSPSSDFGADWEFGVEINGSPGNDGISNFQSTIARAAGLSRNEGFDILFATGLDERSTKNRISGENKILALADRQLADPDLLWSLYNQDGHETLKYIYDTFGVTEIEALRRVIVNSSLGRCCMCLCRNLASNDSADGYWVCRYDFLDLPRTVDCPALVLGA